MSAKLSGEKLENRLKSFIDRDIRMISDYVDTKKDAKFECLKTNCGHIWNTSVNCISGGSGCPKCSGNFIDKVSIQDQIMKLKLRSIKIQSSYKGCKKHYDFECLKFTCGHIWQTSWDNVLRRGTGCPKCSGNFLDETTIQHRIETLKLRSINLISSFAGSHKHHEFQCLRIDCKHIWLATWSGVYSNGTGCPKCAGQAMTDEERLASIYRGKIRDRISILYTNGSVPRSVHRDTKYMTEILNYCKIQAVKIPMKPNDGKSWHLDHIIPVSKFDHTDIEQVKLCWNHQNLQWLPAKVNASKYNKLITEYFTDWHYEVIDKLGLSV